MTPTRLSVVVMAAGLGTRMRSATPKHLHPLLGRRLVDWVLTAAGALGPDRLVVVVSPGTEDAYAGFELAVQAEPRGTGDAVGVACAHIGEFEGNLLVLAGDSPLLGAELLEELVEEHRVAAADVTLLTFQPDQPLPYGRILRDEAGGIIAVVEEADATPEQQAVTELNASTYVFRADPLRRALGQLDRDNVQGELYLTDAIAAIIAEGGRAASIRSPDPDSPVGVNTRRDLARAASVLRDRINERHMLGGVTLVDPDSTWIDVDVRLEADAVVQPFTVLSGQTTVAAGAEIGPFVVARDVSVGPGAIVGPFCYLRPGTVLEERVKAGTFVEIKASHIGEGAKVPHLSYIGDAEIGSGTNIGAGNITANLPPHRGEPKQRTRIGRNVKTSVHNSFVAPVEIGDGAWTGAGSVITEDVPPDALAIARARQVNKEGYAARDRDG